jgi:DNA-binding LytR/AlgR family response regulator
MDIRIKGEKDGIDTAAKIGELYQIPIIFLSDLKDQKTLTRALKTPSYSFLEKPVSEFNLKTQIEFALEKHYVKETSTAEGDNPLKETLFVKADSGYIKLLTEEILWVEAGGAYCKVKTKDKEILLSKNMREFCEHLDPKVFIRIHKFHTVNATKIDNLAGSEVIINNERLKIGKSYIKIFKERLNIV